MATMKEIADLAGVSRGTVDRVLNHRGIVNAETEKKVLEIAKLLHYEPNKAGIALAAQKKKIKIGVLLFGADNPFFDEVMDGLRRKLEELSIYGCSIVEKRIPFDLDRQLRTIDALVAEGIHGLILSPYNDKKVQEKIDGLWENGIPCVTVNTDIPDSKRIAYVGSDYYKCGQTAVGLLQLMTDGQIKVGIITGSRNVLCHEERIAGFLDRLSIKLPPSFYAYTGDSSDSSRNVSNIRSSDVQIIDIIENEDDDYQSFERVSSLLAQHPDLSALYFTAAGVYGGCRAILNASLQSVPKVITFDAVPTTQEMLNRGVISATICQQPDEQGARSLTLLVDYLLTGNLPEETLVFMDLSIKIKENL